MFSGIISATTKITKTREENDSLFLTFKRPDNWDISLGDSICTNGTCLTVQDLTETEYTTELMPETLHKTTFGSEVPELVNLESSLALGDTMDGHFVTGHIDAVGEIINIQTQGNTKVFTISFPGQFHALLAPKGSITVDGIALTVVDVGDHWFTVSLVDYTLQHTTFKDREVGDAVNLEFDILAKYIARHMSTQKHE